MEGSITAKAKAYCENNILHYEITTEEYGTFTRSFSIFKDVLLIDEPAIGKVTVCRKEM